jgi:hypothetical protein
VAVVVVEGAVAVAATLPAECRVAECHVAASIVAEWPRAVSIVAEWALGAPVGAVLIGTVLAQ